MHIWMHTNDASFGMQAEHLDKEVGSEDGTPAMEAAAPRSKTGEFVARIPSSARTFP